MFTEFEPPFRSNKILAHARGQKCTLRIPGKCNGNPETTVSCHIRDRHKGMGIKASDSSIAFGCSGCHAYLDTYWFNGDVSAETLFKCIIQGMQETQEILIRDGVIGFPHNQRRGAMRA